MPLGIDEMIALVKDMSSLCDDSNDDATSITTAFSTRSEDFDKEGVRTIQFPIMFRLTDVGDGVINLDSIVNSYSEIDTQVFPDNYCFLVTNYH